MQLPLFLEEKEWSLGCGPAMRIGPEIFPIRPPDDDLTGADDPDEELVRIRQTQELTREIALDPHTARLMFRVATALCNGTERLLLEGEPGTSKTTVATLTALLLGWRVVRLNFSANVREEMIVGSFQPDPTGERTWAWVDGLAVYAAVHGHVLLLDELNVAPPAVTDRLLSLLEFPPSLRLIERDGRPVEVSPYFRVIATQNPEDHAGRRPNSPAVRDRLVEYRQPPPDQTSMVAAIEHWILGRAAPVMSPSTADFDLGGPYSLVPLAVKERLCPSLAEMSTAHGPLVKVAKVAATISEQCRSGVIGRDHPSGYLFGRRQLRGFVAALERDVQRARLAEEADLWPRFVRTLQTHFLQPFVPGADREAVRILLAAEGLLGAGHLRVPPGRVRRLSRRRGL